MDHKRPIHARRLAERRAQQAQVGPRIDGPTGIRSTGGPNALRSAEDGKTSTSIGTSGVSDRVQAAVDGGAIGLGPEAQHRRHAVPNAQRNRKPLSLKELETAPAYRAISSKTGEFTKHVVEIQQEALDDAKRRTPSQRHGAPPAGSGFLASVLQEDHEDQVRRKGSTRTPGGLKSTGGGIGRSRTQQYVGASRQASRRFGPSGARTVRNAASSSLAPGASGIQARRKAPLSTSNAGPQTFRGEGWADPAMQAGGGGGGEGTQPTTPGSTANSTGRRGPRRGSIQVARSLARRRQARMELQGLTSGNGFVNSFWYGNAQGAGTAAVVVPRGTDSKQAAGGSGVGEQGGPQQWTGAGKDGVVRRAPAGAGAKGGHATGMYKRQSLTEQQLQDIIKEHDQAAPGRRARAAARRKVEAAAGQSRRAGSVGRQSSRLGFDRDGGEGAAASGGDPTALGNPAEVSLRAQQALARDEEPSEGLSGCWARCTRGCREWYVSYQRRRGVVAQDVVLTGRAREAAEALQLTGAQLRLLHSKFIDLDAGLDGRIHVGTFLEEWLNMDRTPITDAVYTALVENTTGRTMGFNDFVLLVCVVSLMTEQDLLRLIFGCFDSDSSGGLDEEETVRMLIMVQPNREPLFGGNFRVALKEFDANQDGKISFDEFVVMHRRFPQLLYPAFQFQARVQERSLGVGIWKEIARRTVALQAAARKDGGVVAGGIGAGGVAPAEAAARSSSARGIAGTGASRRSVGGKSRRKLGSFTEPTSTKSGAGRGRTTDGSGASGKYGRVREDKDDILLAAADAQALPTTAAAASGRGRGRSRSRRGR